MGKPRQEEPPDYDEVPEPEPELPNWKEFEKYMKRWIKKHGFIKRPFGLPKIEQPEWNILDTFYYARTAETSTTALTAAPTVLKLETYENTQYSLELRRVYIAYGVLNAELHNDGVESSNLAVQYSLDGGTTWASSGLGAASTNAAYDINTDYMAGVEKNLGAGITELQVRLAFYTSDAGSPAYARKLSVRMVGMFRE